MTNHGQINADEYTALLDSVKRVIASSRARAVLAANTELIFQYWQIGHEILRRQQDEGWGKKVVPRLSADLRTAFPEAKGYSQTNLNRMLAFARAWSAIFPQAVGKLPWGHIVALLESLDTPATREFYAQRAVQEGWARHTLINMIQGGLHLRPGQALTNFDRTIPPEAHDSVKGLAKDPYILDFLDGTARHERDMEDQIVANLVRFLQQLGTGFAFVGRQYPLVVGGEEFFIDLLFYHLKLRRYVVVELKDKGFAPEHMGKLAFYVAAIDGEVRDPVHDDPTVGILLVKSRNAVVVEYSLGTTSTPVAVGTHTALPREVRAVLPSAEELAGAIATPVREDSPEGHEEELL